MPRNTTKTLGVTNGGRGGLAGYTELCESIAQFKRDSVMARAAYRCPRCNHQLAWHQVARHTWWSPIVCRGCRARIHYDGKQWFSAGWPLVVAILVLNGLAFLGPK